VIEDRDQDRRGVSGEVAPDLGYQCFFHQSCFGVSSFKLVPMTPRTETEGVPKETELPVKSDPD